MSSSWQGSVLIQEVAGQLCAPLRATGRHWQLLAIGCKLAIGCSAPFLLYPNIHPAQAQGVTRPAGDSPDPSALIALSPEPGDTMTLGGRPSAAAASGHSVPTAWGRA